VKTSMIYGHLDVEAIYDQYTYEYVWIQDMYEYKNTWMCVYIYMRDISTYMSIGIHKHIEHGYMYLCIYVYMFAWL
jgi:hypothetical protein